LNQKY